MLKRRHLLTYGLIRGAAASAGAYPDYGLEAHGCDGLATAPAVFASTLGSRLLLAAAVLLLTGCTTTVIERLSIRDWEPSVNVSGISKVTVRSSHDEVKVLYRRKF